MKYKLLNPLVFVALVICVLEVPITAQSTDPSVKSKQNDQLEQRSQIAIEEAAPKNKEQADAHTKPHPGGKQSFRGKSFRNEEFRRYGYRQFRYNHQGFGPGRFGQPFNGRGFRSPLNNPRMFRNDPFNRNMYKDRRPLQYNRGARPHVFKSREKAELKTLKDQIWKDGVMDLKERDSLRKKMEAFRSNQPSYQKEKNANRLNRPRERNK